MNKDVISYHFTIRILGVIALLVLLVFSDYSQNIGLLMALVIFYVLYSIAARLKLFMFKQDKLHVFNLFFDVTILSVAVAVRGGLRSDFYLGYFLILGYVLIIRKKALVLKLSSWIVLNYCVVTYFYTDSELFSFGRLFIRMILLIGTTLLLERYSLILAESETLREKAVKMAMFDVLTGLYNRRILDFLEDLYIVNKEELYVALIDLDDFKLVNDTYGHAKGDEVLVALAKAIQRPLRGDSICIRFGGEEFLLLFQNCSLQEVNTIIRKVQESMLIRRFDWLDAKMNITFTAGVSFRMKEEAIADTIERADIALYNGKNSGKNCIVLHDQLLKD